jgi:hypothetical protein
MPYGCPNYARAPQFAQASFAATTAVAVSETQTLLTNDGIQLVYAVSGKQGPVVIFLHGESVL